MGWTPPTSLPDTIPGNFLFSLVVGLSRTNDDLLFVRELLVQSFPSLLAFTAWLDLA